ncbi:MAG: hypothetical protein K8L91_02065 [Anaerolineae bacterium]|nr:hypothetical protein [Anaerolineae bacterium]
MLGRFKKWFRLVLILLALTLAACRQTPEGERTPTVAPTNSPNVTRIAQLPTRTPIPSRTASDTPLPATTTATSSLTGTPVPTLTASYTLTLTLTPRPTDTPSVTPSTTASVTIPPTAFPTQTNTATITRTFTITPSPIPSRTATVTRTHTPLPTNTPRPTFTFTPTATPTFTASPTYSATPSRTPSPTATFTPSRTPSPRPTNTPTITLSPTLGPTNTPTPTPSISRTPNLDEATLVLPNSTRSAPSTSTPLPTFTFTPFPSATQGFVIPPTVTLAGGGGFATVTPFGGGSSGIIPNSSSGEQSGVVVRTDAGVLQSANGEPLGIAYDVGPQGQEAIFVLEGDVYQMYISGFRLNRSPASEFGMGQSVRVVYAKYDWGGGRIALVLNADQAVTDQGGVWVVDINTQEGRQVMRNDWENTAREAIWSPDGSNLIIRMNTPAGPANTFITAGQDANAGFQRYPYANATWSADGTSVIFSGAQHGGGAVLGYVSLYDPNHIFQPVDFFAAGSWTEAATEISPGRLVFLAGPGPSGPFRLYVMNVGGTPTALSAPINGQVISWQWNNSRSALLVLVEGSDGRRVYVMGTDGSVRDATPANAYPTRVEWRN